MGSFKKGGIVEVKEFDDDPWLPAIYIEYDDGVIPCHIVYITHSHQPVIYKHFYSQCRIPQNETSAKREIHKKMLKIIEKRANRLSTKKLPIVYEAIDNL